MMSFKYKNCSKLIHIHVYSYCSRHLNGQSDHEEQCKPLKFSLLVIVMDKTKWKKKHQICLKQHTMFKNSHRHNSHVMGKRSNFTTAFLVYWYCGRRFFQNLLVKLQVLDLKNKYTIRVKYREYWYWWCSMDVFKCFTAHKLTEKKTKHT